MSAYDADDELEALCRRTIPDDVELYDPATNTLQRPPYSAVLAYRHGRISFEELHASVGGAGNPFQ